MMRSIVSLLACPLVLVGSGCAQMKPNATADVKTAYARTATGCYLNSGLFPLGRVFLWDRADGTAEAIKQLNSSASPTPSGIDTSDSLSSETDIAFSANVTNPDVKASLSAKIASDSSITRTNASRVSYGDGGLALLNSSDDNTRAWREQLAQQHSGDVRYLLISDVIQGDKLDVQFHHSFFAGGTGNVAQYGDITASVNYSGQQEFTLSTHNPGQTIPLEICFHIFQLVPSSEGPMFTDDPKITPNDLDFQKLADNSSQLLLKIKIPVPRTRTH